MARARLLGAERSQLLNGCWELAAVTPGLARAPADLNRIRLDWIACEHPMPVAAALRAVDRWDFDRPRDFDADEWWYRCRFTLEESERSMRLRFGGLATIADVWLNGHHLLHSDSMFLEHVVDSVPNLRGDNELVLRFHALAQLLAAAPKKPRARWRTGLVAHQALRWYRTSLLGRMPGWCPPVSPVGPWRPIAFESAPVTVTRASVHTSLASREDNVGIVDVRFTVTGPPDFAAGTLTVGDVTLPLQTAQSSEGAFTLMAAARLPGPERWWPHTHGSPSLYPVHASLGHGATAVTIDFGRVGFRTLSADHGPDGRGFGLTIHDVPVFCRGVCWTPIDLARLSVAAAEYRAALEQLRDAGVNMIRIPGTMSYEADHFHDLCDELGILVWQDLMFANMDYPWADEAFARLATAEVRQTLDSIQSRPSLAVVCGNSEVDQQVAMLGLPASLRDRSGCEERIADLVRELAPAAVWLPTTPVGGTFPFQTDVGVSHYYGVGAYRRPFEDARRSNVRFAAECLAFSNVPEPSTVSGLIGGGERPGTHPRWKARVPRDAGAGWDFEDVRDHYVERLFGINAVTVRERDAERYLSLGRIASGEAMQRTFAEWRRPGSSCRGGLVWLARDLWPGAGWGIIDSASVPKAAYWHLKRAWAPVALLNADEGLNGLWLHAVNETPEPIAADLRVALYRDGIRLEPDAHAALDIPARGSTSVHANGLFDGFLDLTYAYRFGPPQHDVVASTIRDRSTGNLLAAEYYFPGAIASNSPVDIGLNARVERSVDGYALVLGTERFAHGVAIDIDGFCPDDNYFHLEPDETRRVGLRATAHGAIPRGHVTALNSRNPQPILIEETVHAR